MDFLKNVVINLKATGVSAVMCVWILAIMTLGVYGDTTLGDRALTILMVLGIAFLGGLAQNTTSVQPIPQKTTLPPKKNDAQNAKQTEKDNRETD